MTATMQGIRAAIASADYRQHEGLQRACYDLYTGEQAGWHDPHGILSHMFHHVVERYEDVVYGSNRSIVWKASTTVLQHLSPEPDTIERLTFPKMERYLDASLNIKFIEEIHRSDQDFFAVDLLLFSLAKDSSDLDPVNGQQLAVALPVLWLLDSGHIVPFFEQFVNAYRATEKHWSDKMLRHGLRDMFHGAIIQTLQYVVKYPQNYDPDTVPAWQAPLLAAQFVERLRDVLAGETVHGA